MAESENFEEQYKNMTHQELNSQLRMIYDLLPSGIKNKPRYFSEKYRGRCMGCSFKKKIREIRA